MWRRLSPTPATYSASTPFTTPQPNSATPRADFREPTPRARSAPRDTYRKKTERKTEEGGVGGELGGYRNPGDSNCGKKQPVLQKKLGSTAWKSQIRETFQASPVVFFFLFLHLHAKVTMGFIKTKKNKPKWQLNSLKRGREDA